jgi:uncharacterized protein DUF4349/putative zinc finger protein
MGQSNHSIEQEELMAYLDGELSTDRAAAAVAHLERCMECQRLAAVLGDVSQNLMAWEVASSSSRIESAITSALEEREQESSTPVRGQTWRGIFRVRGFAPWAFGLAAICLVALMVSKVMEDHSNRTFQSVAMSVQGPNAGKENQAGAAYDRLEQFSKLKAPPASPIAGVSKIRDSNPFNATMDQRGKLEAGSSIRALPNGPMIVRTAGITLTTKDFDGARSGLDDILKRHHGYVGELNVNTPAGVGRTLTASLRVPVDQLDATLVDLRKLGRVEAESQAGQEVTAQYVDLEARLSNVRNTERRLTDLLRQRTGKLSDVLAVETELSSVRGEIESMEAQRKNLANQVDFATLGTTINEDYKAQLQVMPPSTSTQFRNAAVDGYKSMVDGIVGVAVFLFSYGPSLLLWAALLYFPIRVVWKRLRRGPE